MKYTKGEWKARTKPTYTQNYVTSDIGGELGTIIALGVDCPADTHLIAAAPDMYLALKAILAVSNSDSPRADNPWLTARQALAKAGGKGE